MVKVSVVTPSYNQAAFLEATLRSVLEQDYPEIEYLVVDGGSTDGSLEIIRKYAGRLAWWVSEPDHGQAEAINKGLQRATGEVVAWLNSDDIYLPGAVRAAVQALEAEPELGLVYGDMLSLDSAGQTTNLQRFGDWGLAGLMRFRIIGQPAVFMRRAALESAALSPGVFLDPSLHFLLDHHLWLRIGRDWPIRHQDGVWAGARYHAEAKNVARAAEFGAEALRLAGWMQNAGGAIQAQAGRDRSRILAGAHLFDAHYLLDGGLPRPALAAYGRCFKLHPPTALREMHRIAYAAASLLGNVEALRRLYLKLRSFRRRKA